METFLIIRLYVSHLLQLPVIIKLPFLALIPSIKIISLSNLKAITTCYENNEITLRFVLTDRLATQTKQR